MKPSPNNSRPMISDALLILSPPACDLGSPGLRAPTTKGGILKRFEDLRVSQDVKVKALLVIVQLFLN